jgi:hypothetical protein
LLLNARPLIARFRGARRNRPVPRRTGVDRSPLSPYLPVATVHQAPTPVAKARPLVWAVILVRVFGEIGQIIRFYVVAVHHVLSRSCATAFGVHGRTAHSPRVAAPVTIVAASPALHAQTGLQSCETVCRDAVDFAVPPTSLFATSAVDAELLAIGIFAGQVQQVDAGENCKEAAEERNGVAGVDRVETLE